MSSRNATSEYNNWTYIKLFFIRLCYIIREMYLAYAYSYFIVVQNGFVTI